MVRRKVLRFLEGFQEMWSGGLGKARAPEHKIELTAGAMPVYQAPYLAGQRFRKIEKAAISRMQDAGVIEPIFVEWAGSAVLVPKKGSILQFCDDYKTWNAVLVRDSYSILHMDECIDSLANAAILTIVECNSGYWQTRTTRTDRKETIFTSHSGLSHFVSRLVILKIVPGIFQRAINSVMSGAQLKNALEYLEGVIIYCKIVMEHSTHVQEVLQLLRPANLTLKLAECFFLDTFMFYFGHTIRLGQLDVDKENLIAIERARAQTNHIELRLFLSMRNLHGRFVSSSAKIAALLDMRSGKRELVEFDLLTDTEFDGFQELEKETVSPPVVVLFSHGYRYTSGPVASDYQAGCALLQKQSTSDRLAVGHWSRTLAAAGRNYLATDKVCLAGVRALLALRPYLYSVNFTLRTNH